MKGGLFFINNSSYIKRAGCLSKIPTLNVKTAHRNMSNGSEIKDIPEEGNLTL
jgi:hypothetical protein